MYSHLTKMKASNKIETVFAVLEPPKLINVPFFVNLVRRKPFLGFTITSSECKPKWMQGISIAVRRSLSENQLSKRVLGIPRFTFSKHQTLQLCCFGRYIYSVLNWKTVRIPLKSKLSATVFYNLLFFKNYQNDYGTFFENVL